MLPSLWPDRRLAVFAFALTLAAAPCPSATGATSAAGDTIADRVLGQLDFTHKLPNLPDGRSLSGPTAVAVDDSVTPGRLYVLDFWNNRVLGWRGATGFANGQPADIVLGQPDFLSTDCNTGGRSARSLCTSPWYGSYGGLAVDRAGNLYVSDVGNFRVLEFDSPFTTDTVADRVLGQEGSFTSGACNLGGRTAASLCSPRGVAVDDGGNLWVADTGNHRVLFFKGPVRSGQSASRVFGEKGRFHTAKCTSGTDGLCGPQGVAVDAQRNLYVADTGNSRVLIYRAPLATDASADRVLGQRGFGPPRYQPFGQDSLQLPNGLALDPASGDLYVADTGKNRVVRYRDPLGQATVLQVFGGRCDGVPDADELCIPQSVAVDDLGNLYVVDRENNRVLAYDRP
jgi:DNA-binding beta-propeller fold protein YncE